jgi:hypothetical protein
LDRHVQSWLPYIECVSRRLQAVIGVRNKNVFSMSLAYSNFLCSFSFHI